VTGLNTRLALYCCGMMDDVKVLMRRVHFAECSRYDPTAKGPFCGMFSLLSTAQVDFVGYSGYVHTKQGPFCGIFKLRSYCACPFCGILSLRSYCAGPFCEILSLRSYCAGPFCVLLSLRSCCAGSILWTALFTFLLRMPFYYVNIYGLNCAGSS
jgi:hypothetical protein